MKKNSMSNTSTCAYITFRGMPSDALPEQEINETAIALVRYNLEHLFVNRQLISVCGEVTPKFRLNIQRFLDQKT